MKATKKLYTYPPPPSGPMPCTLPFTRLLVGIGLHWLGDRGYVHNSQDVDND
ncbi:TPA: hypothetical protein ACHWFX_002722 [Providencia stuartii]|uniref:hypothetical protein n=1 Tax=unclassified Providencia TaxID=2633465 RepID=UPI0013B03A9E|nr:MULTISPECIES: hypothetical protein [Providencia]ELR5064362.1 hypothetical protein [Providencia rettgeri]ELR5181265.1 hypothetical protein [Providencia rettgeri]EMB3082521.1 hypothetical protein [Providencia rettgeri]HCT9037098.1 hypothetical protein [Providencia rettgeri]